ncbi:Phospholipase [Mycena venus]|uniref:Phospholipase n=1 Tax=Mycena venus TaxID=2733690 RepID=A0A8H6YCH1_9AGAR|nr:Phospholipase [Mycena venus]
MSFFKKLGELVEKVPEGLQHARDEAIGLWNPNRRHDDPEEKRADEIRAEINAGHRFNSFATERAGNFVKWHIDGHDYFWALSEMTGGSRPSCTSAARPRTTPEWRLDRLLKRKAEQGVKVHVIVYKEVTQTMSMSSKHTKSALEALHPNITCLRHPDHIGSKDTVEFWSHHEKVVVVDNHYACIGGLDLCFGRWVGVSPSADTHTHTLADVHPTDFSLTLFPGQDYNNARIMDFQNVYNYASNALSGLESARMPWHDVHMTLAGPVVLDIVQHFTERWNEIKKRKYREKAWVEARLSLERRSRLARAPAQRRGGPERGGRAPPAPRDVALDGAPVQAAVAWVPRRRMREREEGYVDRQNPGMHVQVVRSVSDWSHGVLTEHSIQNAYIQLIQEAEHFIYIENQFFISTTYDKDEVKNQIARALVERIIRAAQEDAKFQVIVTIPEVPGFSGNIKDEGSLKIIMAAQYRTINRGGHSIYEEIRKAGFEPLDYIRFYHLRSYDRINAPLSTYINEIEQQGGVKYLQAQVALARQWIGNDEKTDQKDVTLNIPVETKESLVVSDKTPQKTETYPIPESEDAARELIERFEAAAKAVRGDEDVSDNVAQHMLCDRTGLLDEKWLGTEQEELDAYVSELLYIHTKLMIVDDKRVIMGSANINDRSQKGDGDSEIALVVEDTDMIDSTMDGKPYQVARFATSLRRKIFREHLGLIEPQLPDKHERPTSFMRPAPTPNDDELGSHHDRLVADPLSDDTLNLWNNTARKNREIFTELFRPTPTNLVRDWKAYENYVPKVKTGHVVPGVPLERVKERLSEVRGALVECPLDFLIDEKEFVEGAEWKGLNPTLPIYI